MPANRVVVTEPEEVRWEPDPNAPPIVAMEEGYDPATGLEFDSSDTQSHWERLLGAGLNLAHIAFKYGSLRRGQDPERTRGWRTSAQDWLKFITDKDNPSRLGDYAQSVVDDAYKEDEDWNKLRTDELTGLPNRKRWLEDIIHAYKWVNAPVSEEEQKNGERAIVVVFADLDGFKNLNDEKGHAAGNSGIQRFAEQFATLLRRKGRGPAAHDLAARPHGDELLGTCRVIAKNVEEVAKKMVERLQQRLDEGAPAINAELARLPNKNPSSNYEPNVRTSVGYAVLRCGDSLENFLDRADDAMYKVKAARRDKLTEVEVRDWTTERLNTAREMAAILKDMPGERRTYLSILRLIQIREQQLRQQQGVPDAEAPGIATQ